MPQYRDYEKRITRETRSGLSIVVGADAEQVDPNGQLLNITEMTAQGRLAYTYDWTRYQHLDKEYREHQRNIKKLSTWMQDTVSSNYRRNYFDPEANLDI
ncbi:hypothetical protein F5B17DRAFT_422519 [Nemania serpens]|nr:hypothetical protein F5B17DRAFT_422519 [Nemania serpens]